MAAIPDLDAELVGRFGLGLDRAVISMVQEHSGLKLEEGVVPSKSNPPDGKYVLKRLPGRAKPGEVTLSRPFTGDDAFQKWVTDARAGNIGSARKTGGIVFYDYANAVVQRLEFVNGWPKSLEVSAVKAGGTESID